MNNTNETQAESPQRIAFFEPLGSFDGALIDVAETANENQSTEEQVARIA